MSNVCSVVYIFPIKEGKGLVYIECTQDVVYHVIIHRVHTGCSISCDYHHNASTALMCANACSSGVLHDNYM